MDYRGSRHFLKSENLEKLLVHLPDNAASYWFEVVSAYQGAINRFSNLIFL